MIRLLYSVANTGAKIVRNHLAASSDGENFSDVLCFDAPTFARAFAYLDGKEVASVNLVAVETVLPPRTEEKHGFLKNLFR